MNGKGVIGLTLNQQQIEELARLAGQEIRNASDLKQALHKLIPTLPEGNKAGRKKQLSKISKIQE